MQLEFLDPVTDLPRIQAIWTSLMDRAKPSYFLSWGWMEHWLASLPPVARVQLAVVSESSVPQAAFFLGAAELTRHRVLKSRGLFLNATGHAEYDELCLEHNGILSSRSLSYPLRELLARLPEPWEEFVMPAMDASRLPADWLDGLGDSYTVIQQEMPSPYIDLHDVRQCGGDYPSLLGDDTRARIRRSYRLAASGGPVQCDVAQTLSEALDIFEELVRLHQAVWQARGKQGAFTSEYFHAFHLGLIARRFAAGEIQLLRIVAGETTIGCLYNFVFRGTVSFYQGGINYDHVDRRASPGLLCLAEAVQHNARAHQQVYDLLGGTSRYKANLSTGQGRLVWTTVQKPRVKFAMERALRASKRAATRWARPRRRLVVGVGS